MHGSHQTRARSLENHSDMVDLMCKPVIANIIRAHFNPVALRDLFYKRSTKTIWVEQAGIRKIIIFPRRREYFVVVFKYPSLYDRMIFFREELEYE